MSPTKPAAKKTPAKARAATTKTPPRRRSVVKELIAPADAFQAQSEDHVVQELPIGKVKPDPHNVRRDLGDISELSKSIGEKGVLQPLTVTRDGTGWMVVFGHRRLAGATAAKLATVPCIVRDMDPLDRLETQVAENLHRADLTPIEEARAYQRLADLGATQRRIVSKVARSQSHISKRLSLLALPDKIQAKIEAQEISIGDALELTRLVELPDAGQLITAATQRAHNYGGMRAAVDETVRGHERAVARDKARAELAREKIAEVPYREYGFTNSYTPIGKGWDQLDVTKTRCKTDGTLAAAIKPDGTIVYVCTDAARYHAAVDDKPGETAAQKRKRLEDEREHAAIKDAITARQDAMGKLVGALSTWKFPKGDIGPLIRVLAVAVAKFSDVYAPETIAALIGLDDDSGDYYGLLEQHAAKGDVELLQVSMATALVGCDPGTSWYWTERPPREDGEDYYPDEYDEGGIKLEYSTLLDTLEQLAGYTPTSWEHQQLASAKTDTVKAS